MFQFTTVIKIRLDAAILPVRMLSAQKTNLVILFGLSSALLSKVSAVVWSDHGDVCRVICLLVARSIQQLRMPDTCVLLLPVHRELIISVVRMRELFYRDCVHNLFMFLYVPWPGSNHIHNDGKMHEQRILLKILEWSHYYHLTVKVCTYNFLSLVMI
jgi:hypothetical protein